MSHDRGAQGIAAVGLTKVGAMGNPPLQSKQHRADPTPFVVSARISVFLCDRHQLRIHERRRWQLGERGKAQVVALRSPAESMIALLAIFMSLSDGVIRCPMLGDVYFRR